MKIKIGKYYINSDKRNWWITEEYKREKSKYADKVEEKRVTGYCWTLDKCIQSFAERQIGGSDANTVLQFLETVRSVYDDMVAFNTVALENDLEKMKRFG